MSQTSSSAKKISSKKFQNIILQWFKKNGRKNLPWQLNKNPYKVWVSEMMLQQTQVSTVIPYFTRFIKEFPDINSLAEASLDKVLQLWAGLGYYSRARNLHKTAKIISKDFGGVFPDNLEVLQSFPGIGRSTAAAILSLAFNQKAAILDGNVKRVLARINGINKPINDKHVLAELWKHADYYSSDLSPADYTQAMMDLGATVCTRTNPKCINCPCQNICAAHINGLENLIPVNSKKKKSPIRITTFLIFHNLVTNTILFEKRPLSGIWGGLWCLPEIQDTFADISLIQESFHLQHTDSEILNIQKMQSFKHIFTHFKLEIMPVLISFKNRVKILNNNHDKSTEAVDRIRVNKNATNTLALPTPVKKIICAINRDATDH